MHMKIYLVTVISLLSFVASAQKDSINLRILKHEVFNAKAVAATISFGIIDQNRQTYTLPPGFEKSNTTGFAPVYFKLEKGITKHISLAASFGYDGFIYNFSQVYQGYNEVIKRYKTNQVQIFGYGLTAFYHLNEFIKVKRLDPFAGIGLAVNNSRNSAYPQGDSALIRKSNFISPYLRAGARYYISDGFALFGEVGYDQQSILSFGFTARFF